MVSRRSKNLLLLDVGGTFVKVGICIGGELQPRAEFSTPMHSDGSAEQIRQDFAAAVSGGVCAMRKCGVVAEAIGVAIPGPFEYATGVSKMRHKFAALYDMSLTDLLHSLPDVGALAVCYLHDVNAVLLGEMSDGAARGYANAAVVTLGTGLGFAYSVEGEVQYSASGSPAESIYNLPFGGGIAEDYISKRGILRTYAELCASSPTPSTPPADLTVAELARMAFDGDERAAECFERAAAALAEVVRPRLAAHGTECLLLGGQISRSFVLMEQTLRRELSGVASLRHIDRVEHISSAPFYGLLTALTAADR